MKDFSLPPYDLGEIGQEVRRLGKVLNVHCDLADPQFPFLRENGYFSMPTISDDMVRIGAKYGIHIERTGDLGFAGVQLQRLITALGSRGII